MRWDAFISHASEDKKEVARPLAELLRNAGCAVWLDENELLLGDSLRQKIDQGLAQSKYGIVILSEAFFSKHWPQQELNGLATRETAARKVILPVWHGVDHGVIAKYSPLLADRLGVDTKKGLQSVASEILKVFDRSDNLTQDESPHRKMRKESLLRRSLMRVEDVIRSRRSHYVALSVLVIVAVAAALAWGAWLYTNKSSNDVKVELARIPDLRLALLSTATSLELQIQNVGEEPARQVTIEGVAWQMDTAAQTFHKTYSEREVRPQSDTSLYLSSNNETRSEKIWGIWDRTDSQPISGYFVIKCQNCGYYRAWAFNGTAPGQFSSWPLAEFKYPEKTPRSGQCVDFPMGSCGRSEQLRASGQVWVPGPTPGEEPAVIFKKQVP